MLFQTELERMNAFMEAANLNKKYDPWFRRKKPDDEFAFFEIVSCGHPDWWYAKYIGIQFLGHITLFDLRGTDRKELYRATACIIAGKNIHSGRSFSLKDIIMI